jgi:cytochrome d ubiquinol oxidase subunit I
MILLSALSYILYKRANRIITARWLPLGSLIIAPVFVGAFINILALSVYGFFVPAKIRVGLSLPQAASTLSAVVVGLVVNRALLRGAPSVGPIIWGRVSVRGQVTLFLLGMAFTWVMGLMGFIRSSGRLGWHIHEIMRDASPWAASPGLGTAAAMVTFNMALFWVLLLGLFWVSQRALRRADAPERIWAAADMRRERDLSATIPPAVAPTISPAISNDALLRNG